MSRPIHIDGNEHVMSEVMVVLAAIAISIGLALPMWGLAVILFNFTVVFLPIFVGVAIVAGIVKAVHTLKKRARMQHG